MAAHDPSRTTSPEDVPTVDPALTGATADPGAVTAGDSFPTITDQSRLSTSRYELGEEIAHGGMGMIYRATDTSFGREIAVKVLLQCYGPSSGAARRFAEEARITGQLQHPSIPPAHDLGTLPDGRQFLAMKLIKGETLDSLLVARSDPAHDRGRFVAIFESICQALAYAHAHHVIHRDLKPANVMVGSFGEVQLMDWGLAKLLTDRRRPESDPDGPTAGTEIQSLRDSDAEFTQPGSVLGTPAFMPPEQAIGAIDQIDFRSDVFGLGGILAAILTGRPPFQGNSAEAIRQMAAKGKMQDCFARLDGSGADPELVALCKRCLAHEKEDRPANAAGVAAVVATLRAAADERARRAELELVKAEGERAKAELRAVEQRKRRRVQLVLAAAVCAMLLLAGVGGTVIRAQTAARHADADNTASVALGRAELLANQGESLDPKTPEEARAAVGVWEQAEAAAAQAEAPAAACTAQVATQVAVKAAEIRNGLARARRDAALLQGLADVRTTPDEYVGGNRDYTKKVRVFRSTLEGAGLPARLTGTEAVEAAITAIQAERPGIRTTIRSTIDHLLSISPLAGYHADFEFAAWQEAANNCDDNPFRREARGKSLQANMTYLTKYWDPISKLAPTLSEPPIGLLELIRLAEQAKAEDPPLDAVVMLSKTFDLLDGSSNARLRRLLQVARDRHPSAPDLLKEFGNNMMSFWRETGEPLAFAEAFGSYRACIALRPDDAEAYYHLGNLLSYHGDDPGAVAAYRAALARDPKMNFARNNLAIHLNRLGDLDGGIAVLREAVRLDPTFDVAQKNLAELLIKKEDTEGAIACYQDLVRHSLTKARDLLYQGLFLYEEMGDLDGAIATFQEIVRLEPKNQDAVAWMQVAEQARALLPRVPGILAGTDRLPTSTEMVRLADVCKGPLQKRYATAARLYDEAFKADLARDMTRTRRYHAATAAARAARGEGVDAPTDPAARAALREKALAWLRADLAFRKRQAASSSAAERRIAFEGLRDWLGDSYFSALQPTRDRAGLSPEEQSNWDNLWAEVRETIEEARKPSAPPEVAPPPRVRT